MYSETSSSTAEVDEEFVFKVTEDVEEDIFSPVSYISVI